MMRLKDIVDVNVLSLSNDTSPNFEFKYIDISNVNQFGITQEPEYIVFNEAPSRARRLIRKNDVIVSTVRTYLKAIAFIDFEPKDYVVSTGFAVLQPKKNIFPKYLGYYCQSEYFIDKVVSNSKGVSYPAINAGEIVQLPIINLPLSEQQAIANYLDAKTQAIDKKVTLLEQKIETYKKLKRTLINQAITRGLDKNLPLKDSGISWIGQIPQHWEVKRFKSFADTIKGKNLEVFDNQIEGTLPNLSLEYLRNDSVGFEAFVKTNNRNLIVDENDLIIVWDGAGVGEILNGKVGVISSTIAKLKFNKSVNAKFFSFIRYDLEYRLKQIPTGMGIPHLNPHELKNFMCPIPPKSEQEEIAKYLDHKTSTIDAIVGNIGKQIDTLKQLRKTLINDVVTGKIKVLA